MPDFSSVQVVMLSTLPDFAMPGWHCQLAQCARFPSVTATATETGIKAGAGINAEPSHVTGPPRGGAPGSYYPLCPCVLSTINTLALPKTFTACTVTTVHYQR